MIDSNSVGDPKRFLEFAALKNTYDALAPRPLDKGSVTFLMRRGEGGQREILQEYLLDPDVGVPGDAWAHKPNRKPDMQIAVMDMAVAELVANGQPLPLFGDCLMLDLDLSAANLPHGTTLQVGEAVLEVTPEPHNGCLKFRERFGEGALRFVANKEMRHLNLRGIYMRTVKSGVVRLGDRAEVLKRAG